MHTAAFTFLIELVGKTRHLLKREEAVDSTLVVCDLILRLDALKFSNAPTPEHVAINRVYVGVVHGALGKELHEWRPPQVADFVRINGSGRYTLGQTEERVLADLRAELDALERRFSRLKALLTPEHQLGRPAMPSFEVFRQSPIVRAVNAAYREVRGVDQPTGAVTLPGFYGTDAAHLFREGGMEGIVRGSGRPSRGRYNTMPNITDFIDVVKIHMLAILAVCAEA